MNFSKVENLLFNLQSGLLLENLSSKEVKLLEKEYGKEWFTKLGYSEPKYKKPEFKKIKKSYWEYNPVVKRLNNFAVYLFCAIVSIFDPVMIDTVLYKTLKHQFEEKKENNL